jgi:hypothetical protein
MLLPIFPRFQGVMNDEGRKKRLLFIIDGMLVNAAVVLTSGMFLSGYVIYLGGSDFLVGMMTNALTWASIVAVFSFIIFERLARRKKLLLTLLCAARLPVCLAIFMPLIMGKTSATIQVVTVMVILGNIFWGMYAIGYNVWLMNSFSKEERTPFIFRRLFFLRVTFTVFMVLMGFVLDWSGKSYIGFFIVFLTSLILSVGDFATLLGIPEPLNVVAKAKGLRLGVFMEPLKNKPFRNYIIFAFLFYLCNSIAASFSPLYLIRYLKINYSYLSLINIITYFCMIVFTKPWSRLARRLGLRTILRVSGFLIIIDLFLYLFLNSRTTMLLMLNATLSGIGNSGFNAYAYLYRFELMPEENRTIYEGINGAAVGLSLLLGPVVGGFIMELLPVFTAGFIEYSKFQLIFLISFILAAITLIVPLRGVRNKPDEGSCDVR